MPLNCTVCMYISSSQIVLRVASHPQAYFTGMRQCYNVSQLYSFRNLPKHIRNKERNVAPLDEPFSFCKKWTELLVV